MFNEDSNEDLYPHLQLHPATFQLGWRRDTKRAGNCSFHCHAYTEIVYHMSGEGVTRTDTGFHVQFVSGSAVIYPAGVMHDQQNANIHGHDVCVQVLLPETGKKASALTETLYCSRVHSVLVDELVLLAETRRPAEKWAAIACDYRVTAVLIDLLSAISRERKISADSESRDLAAAADFFIRDNYNRILTVAEVASHLQVSESYLRLQYKARYGFGLRKRLVETRISRAREMLVHTVLPVKQIALMCGFQNEQYFATCFRTETGSTPGATRARSRSSTASRSVPRPR